MGLKEEDALDTTKWRNGDHRMADYGKSLSSKREFEAPTPAITQAAEHSLCVEVDDDESASRDHPFIEVSQVLHIEDVGPPSSRRVDGRDQWRVEARLLGTHCSYRVRHRPGGH